MKRCNWTCVLAVVALMLGVASSAAKAGEVENQVKVAMNQLASKAQECKAVVKDALGTSFEDQISKAMEDLKKNPRSLKLQLQVIDILMGQADRLSASLTKTKESDLAAMRDRVVKGLEALAAQKADERDRYQTRAKEAKDDEWRKRYEELAAVCDRLSRSYSLRADSYKSVPITKQLVAVQASIEYLDSVKQVLSSLRDGINTILSDEEALSELQRLSVTIDGVQSSLKQFSEVVLAGAIAGDDTPPAAKQAPAKEAQKAS